MRVTPWLNGLCSPPRRRRSPRTVLAVERLETRTAPGDIASALVGLTALPGALAPAAATGGATMT